MQISQITHSFGDRDILKGVSYTISPGARTALTGDNGSGKTTLLKIIKGIIVPDSGQITGSGNRVISYLPQSGVVHSGATLRQTAELAFSRFHELMEEKKGFEERLAAMGEGDSKITGALARLHEIEEVLLDAGYHRREEQIHRVLGGIGFSVRDFDRDTAEFSGGWQMRIALAVVLLEKPDVMLLDEPTNYLDLEARNWLESFLAEYRGSIIVVSHDRYFLDVTVNTVAELFNGNLRVYHGNFTAYQKQRRVELESTMRAYDKQQDEIAKLETLDAQVLGISVNDPFTNRAFHEDNVLNFPLLCDFNREVVKSYDVYHEDFAGLKGYTAAKRSVFIVDGAGSVSYKWVTDDPGIMPDLTEIMAELK